jgi:hypothetical protein
MEKQVSMENEFIKQDYNGDDVYFEIVRRYDMIFCYAYKKVKKRFLFCESFKKQYIYDFGSDLYDSRCQSWILLSELNSSNKGEKLEYLMQKAINEVNDSIQKKLKYKESIIALKQII